MDDLIDWISVEHVFQESYVQHFVLSDDWECMGACGIAWLIRIYIENIS